MKYAVWLMVLGLIVLHQDFWFWNDDRLILGFMPIGLFYHACLSLAAGVVWFLATRFAWPQAYFESELEGTTEPTEATDKGGTQ